MSKVLQVRVDDTLKKAADGVFTSIGLDASTAVRMFLTAVVEQRALPFGTKGHAGGIELFDGHGSYLCDYGRIHDYSRLNVPDVGEVSPTYPDAKSVLESIFDEILQESDEPGTASWRGGWRKSRWSASQWQWFGFIHARCRHHRRHSGSRLSRRGVLAATAFGGCQ
jgi:hypothetical protein